ncbi:MAG: PEP/pyruvate-binding domain-containing protein [Micropruina sp.]|uniref:PEP/pyruvate-binding domain-containing protein n=1 Tax=Micropruina sp. TaxID=2737536 RepID=UPI0039E6EC1D
MTRASTGIPGLDDTIDHLRIGDNVVWQVDSVADFQAVVAPFVARARADGRRLVYLSFGARTPLLDDLDSVEVHTLDPSVGFERFAIATHELLAEIGPLGFYVVDPLTDLHRAWHSDLMVLNFFKATCPYLFELDTIAYFPLLRNRHSYATVAGIRETTQVLLDLHRIDDALYVHPLKVWQRHSPTMFFPHRLDGGQALSITSSTATTQLFASLARRIDPPDVWQRMVEDAWTALAGDAAAQETARQTLLGVLVGGQGRMAELSRRRLRLVDLLAVASRLVGTGRIGGKALGVLLARAILEQSGPELAPDLGADGLAGRLEPHDSFFVGSDVFVSFLVSNGWWRDWAAHKADGADGASAARLHERIPGGEFPRGVREDFLQVLEHFGQAPIIVRSSSLLEDDYGNAFAGKYDSVFCANQGTPQQRLAAFEDAVRTVYASAVGPQALRYRADRGLLDLDEQMAILVQRVSGDLHGELFFPLAAGVANSSSLYVWDASLPDAGMARLVLGLGTRAVDRTGGDYARIVSLADPAANPAPADELGRWSQRRVDVLDLAANTTTTLPLARIQAQLAGPDWSLLASPDAAAARRLRELGRTGRGVPEVIDFGRLLRGTDFPALLRAVLACLAEAYDHPVDIEFTVNPERDGTVSLNLVQCRPLQTRGVGGAVGVPAVAPERCLLATSGNFMGGNARLPIDWVVLVRPDAYLALGEPDRYAVARRIGVLNRALDGAALLIGPGRWGTSMPSLGVPTHFTDLNRFTALVETTYAAGGFRPELSYGSHFFQELVETGICYAALFDDRPGVLFRPELVTTPPNRYAAFCPDAADAKLAEVIQVARTPGLMLHADVTEQRLLVQWPDDAAAGRTGALAEGPA